MFGMGWPEMAVIGILGVLLFGPDKLPEFARQAGRFIRNAKRMAQDAKDDLTREFGPEFTDTSWNELDPREVVRRAIQPTERPPVDPDAT